jgi:myxalamid-type polyketide synthase MxaE and MxaD
VTAAEAVPSGVQLRQALVALKQLRARVDELEQARTAPIAIVSMACRFPGADSPAAFWNLMHAGVDAISETPVERWDAVGLYDSDPAAAGKLATRWGGFIPDIDAFDAAFFGISPREASQMDPQQRLVLEVAYEALEAGGLTLDRLAGTRTGVFLGAHSHSSDYYLLQVGARELDTYSGTGTSHSVLAGRLSYLWDLHGPSVVVDTACSSSLVAVHLACQSLRTGESDVALVGGVNAMLAPSFTEAASRMRMLATDGRCKPFDARADGFVRGEGCGIVVLKRLSDALSSGDRVLAVIRGSAVNQDGHSNGLTAPNGQAQQAVLAEALASAGVEPAQLSYVEAHGTGTALGDPIEVEALNAVLAARPLEAGPVVLGAAKSNIGHLESAAGIAGLIKVVLSLQHEAIPRVLHFTQLNPHIKMDSRRLMIAAAEQAWPRAGTPRVAGVSSFGWSGTNAHVVLGDLAPGLDAQPPTEDARSAASGPWLLPISARSPAALQALASAYAERLTQQPSIGMGELCAAAGRARSHHEERLALVAETVPEAVAELRAAATGLPMSRLARGRAREPGRADGVVFMVPGQGTQWLGMGRELLANEPVFRATVEACDAAFGAYTDWSIVGQLTRRDPSRLDDVDVIQPLLCAVQIGLAAVWRSHGVVPAAVVGHSLGEVAAAHVAGALDLDSAARVICSRSQLLRRVRGEGGMALVDLPRAAAEAAIAAVGAVDEVCVAASNGPRTTVVSGAPRAIEAVLAELSARDVFCRRISVDVASHSPQMVALAPLLEERLRGLAPRAAPEVAFYSTVTGARLAGERLDAAYWARNLREPVEFGAATAALVGAGYRQFVELSPHPTLVGAVQQVLEETGAEGVAVGSLRRAEPERATLLASLGELYVRGYPVDWARLTPGRALDVELPRYPWQHESYWLALRHGVSFGSAAPTHAPIEHPRLGRLVSQALDAGAEVWEQCIDAATRPELYAHYVHGTAVLPASAIVELLLLGAAGQGLHCLQEVELRRAVHLDPAEPLSLQTVVEPRADGGWQVRLHARDAAPQARWQLVAVAQAGADADLTAEGMRRLSTDQVEHAYPEAVAASDFYTRLAAIGAGIDAPLQVVSAARLGPGGGIAQLGMAGAARLDGALQLGAAVLEAGSSDSGLAMPIAIDEVRAAPGWLEAPCAVVARRDAPLEQDILLTDAAGVAKLEMRGVRLSALGARADPEPLHAIEWQRLAEGSPRTLDRSPTSARWVICGATGADCSSVANALRARGALADITRPAELEASLDAAGPQVGLVVMSGAGGEQADAALDAERLAAGVLGTLQVAAKHDARVWLVTHEAHAIGPNQVPVPAQAALWGLGRVFRAEHPEHLGGLIDLDAASGAADLAELLLSGPPEETAWREGRTWVPRLSPLTDLPVRPFRARADATYLITGGLGGVGLRVADWLVDRGARRLLLVGRTPLPARGTWGELAADSTEGQRVARVRALEGRGVSVHLAAVDVTDAAQLSACLTTFRAEGWPPIAGVIHAAATAADRLLAQLTPSQLGAVLRTKVRGAELLDELCREGLDFCVYFSSLGALLGQPGQGAYAAANAALDALATARWRRGQPALSVNWGAWAGVGFAATPGGQQTIAALEAQGMRSLTSAENLMQLERLLATQHPASPWPQVAVLALDRSRLTVREQPPLLAGVAAVGSQPPACGVIDTGPPELSARLAQRPAEERAALLTQHLQSQIGRVLKLDPARVELTRPLGALGVDSLAAVELRNLLERDLGVSLSATLVWNYPTVADLTPYLLNRLGLGVAESSVPPAPADPHGAIVGTAALSDEEALRILLTGG